uniref:Vacuolar assembling protein n=1 Tax=Mycena chlorophos TaxID=658473 RepID=A0ABQ0LKJ4_MYCCL|nr:vacuolar assembling protein [Mycena chlorophos]
MAATALQENGTSVLNGEKDGDIVQSPVSANSGRTESEEEEEYAGRSEESDGSAEEEDDDEDDDDEPALKYERLGGALPDLLKRDSGSALVVSKNLMAMGTHAGFVHLLDLAGKRIKSFKPHMASVMDICLDETAEWVATASLDGQIVIHSAAESFSFDLKRPIRAISLEPNFAKKTTRAFVCGGMAGNLIMYERGWLGHKDTILHTGEGPIWAVKWRGRLIAWANDLGVKIYDTVSQTRITFIDRPANSPRADLFKCTLHWQDDSTLLIAWADHVKVARVRARPRTQTSSAASAGLPPLLVEITLVLKVDCMIAGLVPHLNSHTVSSPTPSISSNSQPPTQTSTQTHYLLLAYTPPDSSIFTDEPNPDWKKKAAERPELRIVSPTGAELAADALSVADYGKWGCNDYVLAEADDQVYVVLSPRDIVVVRRRDRRDHIAWLVERQRYEEALGEVEALEAETGGASSGDGVVSATEIGQRYIEHLVSDGNFVAAARLTPKVCGRDAKRWENWIFLFQQKRQMQAIIPFVPTDSPRLDHLVYEMILAHFLSHDRRTLLQTIKEWPKEIYDISAVIVAVLAELQRTASTSNLAAPTLAASSPAPSDKVTLMECLAELYVANRQPGKALSYLLRLRRPNVFELIRENNLFTDVQDQALQLVEFDHELMEKRKAALPEGVVSNEKSEAIQLLVDHIHSIPVSRVVAQLQSRPYFLFLYLDALTEKEPHMVSEFADVQVKLYAEFATPRLIDFLRASNEYTLEKAYKVCEERNLVPEMVFLLGRMGNNKQALTLIIERLGDVHRAIDFAKEQNDDDLWEDLLKYSETRPTFIRGLLENVGPEISPIRLIRRIKNGLEIDGLQEALVKILQDFHLQISLLEGCQTILNGDSADFARKLHKDQTAGFLLTGKSTCPMCEQPLVETHQRLVVLFLCRHVVHADCTSGAERLPPPPQPDPVFRGLGVSGQTDAARGLSGKIAFEAVVRARLGHVHVDWLTATPTMGRGTAFTDEDDRNLVAYLASLPLNAGRRSQAIYKLLVANAEGKWPWASRHPSGGWQGRYRNAASDFDERILVERHREPLPPLPPALQSASDTQGTGTESESGPAPRNLTAFTKEDEDNLCVFFAQHRPGGRGRLSETLYKTLVENKDGKHPWATRHPAGSWRSHYRRHAARIDARILAIQSIAGGLQAGIAEHCDGVVEDAQAEHGRKRPDGDSCTPRSAPDAHVQEHAAPDGRVLVPFTEEDIENLCKFLSGQRPLEGGRQYRSNVFYDKLVEDKDGAAHWANRHSAASWYRYYRRHQQELDTRILALQREEIAAAAASAIQSSVDPQRSLEVRVESSILPEAIEGDEGIKNLIMPVPSQSATSRRTAMEPDLVNSLKKLAIDATPTSNDDDINANRQMNGKSSLSSVEPPPEPRVSGQVVTALSERSNQPFSLSSTPATMDPAARAFDMHAFLFADALDTSNSLLLLYNGNAVPLGNCRTDYVSAGDLNPPSGNLYLLPT